MLSLTFLCASELLAVCVNRRESYASTWMQQARDTKSVTKLPHWLAPCPHKDTEKQSRANFFRFLVRLALASPNTFNGQQMVS